MRFTIHTGLKVSPFEQHHGRKRRSEVTNIIKGNKSILSEWTTLNTSVPPKQIPINVAQNEIGEVTDHKFLATNRNIKCCVSLKSPKKRPVKPVSENNQYLCTFLRNGTRKDHWEENMKNNRDLL